MAKLISITDEGKRKLEAELEYLKTEKRREVSEAIKVARGFGDLSENSEYDEAKNEQAKVEAQIIELEETLKNLRVINESDVKTDVVNVGARVKVYDKAFMEEVEYTIVGSTEADPMNGKISDLSPIGGALIGGRVGDSVTAATPGGEIILTILEISKS